MAFTNATITHLFENADGTPASGSVVCTLSGVMTNGDTTIVPAKVTRNLDSSGSLSVSLTSNLDDGTVPASPQNRNWRVDLDILGAEQDSFFITVPAGGGTFDLFSLIPNKPQV